ncbi:RNA polymerase sigma factor [Sphingobacterium kyonggiense]
MKIDMQIFKNLKNGDINAFQQVFDGYGQSIFNTAFKILKSKEQAEEIVQETFLKTWLNRREIDETKDIWPFIYVIAKRLCFNQLRSMKYDMLAQQELLRNMNENVEDSKILLLDIQHLLDESVKALPGRQRQVWIMSREEGKSHKEIAEELGISPNTVKNCLVQTLKTLRHTFKQADYIYLLLFFFLQ